MSEQQKLFRIFKLIFLLSSPITIEELARILECSQRTVYRYFELLESIGIFVKKKNNNFTLRNDIATNPLQFSPVEIEKLMEFAKHLPQQDAVSENLIKRLQTYKKTYLNLPVLLAFKTNYIIENILKAILNKKKIKLIGSLDALTTNTSEIVTEPYFFNVNFSCVLVLIGDKHQYINLNQIADVQILNENIHSQSPTPNMWTTDVFDSIGNMEENIKLQITENARQILMDEYPMTKSYMLDKCKNGIYRFTTIVKDFKAVGRFVLSLPGEVQVIGSTAFQDYLKDKIAAYGI